MPNVKTCFVGLLGLYIRHESLNPPSIPFPCVSVMSNRRSNLCHPRLLHQFGTVRFGCDHDFSCGQLPLLEQQVLLEEIPCEQVDSHELVKSLRANDEDREAALEGLLCPVDVAVLSLPAILASEACARLRQYADKHMPSSNTVDAMDGEPECKVDLDRNDLIDLIGAEAVRCLWSLPALLDARRREAAASCIPGAGSMPPNLPPIWLGGAVLRKYSAHSSGRTMLGFHVDSCDCTANVCLSPPGSHAGGTLFLAAGGRIVAAPPRGEGDVTLHAGDVAHGVGRVTAGVRYSLLVFFQRPGYLFQSLRGRRRTPSSVPS